MIYIYYWLVNNKQYNIYILYCLLYNKQYEQPILIFLQ